MLNIGIPPLSQMQRESLKASIKEYGQKSPIVRDRKTHTIVDGENRTEILKELNIKAIYDDRDFENEEDMRSCALMMNLERRHLSPDQMGQIRSEAKVKYLELRKQDWTQERAAGYVGVPTPTAIHWEDILATKGESKKKKKKQGTPKIKLSKDQKQEIVERVSSGETLESVAADFQIAPMTVSKVVADFKKKKAARAAAKKAAAESPGTATIYNEDYATFLKRFEDKSVDLLLTDPPFSTDVDDIKVFAKWLPKALAKVKSTGRAFVFIGAYPEELQAYLNTALPNQVLVWAYKNTIGMTPNKDHMQNWQACLYFRNEKAPDWNEYEITNLLAAQTVNAPDGRQGEGKYHSWEKPMPLIKNIVARSTQSGDIIIDPFSGSGTHLLAASLLGRKAFGCDIDKKTVKIAVDRGCKLG